ncbi:MAG: hypothetical protein LBJ17_03455 [Dysgonamonadaceae bacterium]|jgi:polyferredoxin|nr:hypothetical protein [Dysgonamonadaceae bacterium]
MKNNEHISDDGLRTMFGQMPVEELPAGFMDKLMMRIDGEVRRKAARRRWMPVLQTAAAVAGLIIIPAAVMFFIDPDFFSSLDFSMPALNIKLTWFPVSVGFFALCLLFADDWLRRHYFSKR